MPEEELYIYERFRVLAEWLDYSLARILCTFRIIQGCAIYRSRGSATATGVQAGREQQQLPFVNQTTLSDRGSGTYHEKNKKTSWAPTHVLYVANGSDTLRKMSGKRLSHLTK
ncbi:unnamed protein product [Ectocarpus fasciculatus]